MNKDFLILPNPESFINWYNTFLAGLEGQSQCQEWTDQCLLCDLNKFHGAHRLFMLKCCE